MKNPALHIINATRSFGTAKALDAVNLSLEAGSVLALLGQSGSGKSTLLRVLAGLEGLDDGQVFSNGALVSSPKLSVPAETRKLGMVFQDFALFPHLTAFENVMFGLNKLDKGVAQARAQTWLESVGLGLRGTSYPHQLSGGEQQRVALARALAPEPTAILMDEPFSGLDPHLRADLQRTMLAALRKAGVAALIVTHDTEEALEVADQVAIIDQGKIIQHGTPQDVYTHPNSLTAAKALGALWTADFMAKDGLVETPFGLFPTSKGQSENGPVTLAARPDTTQITSSEKGLFRIKEVRGVGRFVTVTVERDKLILKAKVEASEPYSVGTCVDVTLAAKDVLIFSKT
jgi:iron(III) transport system ATP-binding protein